jgi:hypothetical protein
VSASLNCHVVRLQHGYCTVTQAGQVTSHCFVLKNCKVLRCIYLFRITTLVTNWQSVAASDRFGGIRQTKCAVVPVHAMKAYAGGKVISIHYSPCS